MRKSITTLLVILTTLSCMTGCKNDPPEDKIYLGIAMSEVQEELGMDNSTWFDYVGVETTSSGENYSYYYTIDSNPDDSSNEFIQALGYMQVEKIITALHTKCSVPAYVWAEMKSTRALDGRQSETYKNLKISWTYHPNNGLEAIYSTID